MKRAYDILVNEKSTRRFLIVGTVGFCINALILTVLYKHLQINLIIAQLIAAETAILVNFLFHNKWTYTDAGHKSLLKRLAEFHASSWTGSAIVTVILVVFVQLFHVPYLLALFVGGIVAMFWNFFWTRFYIWKVKHPTKP